MIDKKIIQDTYGFICTPWYVFNVWGKTFFFLATPSPRLLYFSMPCHSLTVMKLWSKQFLKASNTFFETLSLHETNHLKQWICSPTVKVKYLPVYWVLMVVYNHREWQLWLSKYRRLHHGGTSLRHQHFCPTQHWWQHQVRTCKYSVGTYFMGIVNANCIKYGEECTAGYKISRTEFWKLVMAVKLGINRAKVWYEL